MKTDWFGEYIGPALFFIYFAGIPVSLGYLYHLTSEVMIPVFVGSIFWPALLLGKIGYLLAAR